MTPAMEDGELVLLLVDDVDWQDVRRQRRRDRAVAARRRDDRERRHHGGRGLRHRGRRRARRHRPAAHRSGRARRRGQLRARRGSQHGGRATAVAGLRPAADTFTNAENGAVFSRQRRRLVCSPRRARSWSQGWRINVGFENFTAIVRDPLVRDPFISVFVWTVVYAGLSVLIQFAFGLFLAIALNKNGLRSGGSSARC